MKNNKNKGLGWDASDTNNEGNTNTHEHKI